MTYKLGNASTIGLLVCRRLLGPVCSAAKPGGVHVAAGWPGCQTALHNSKSLAGCLTVATLLQVDCVARPVHAEWPACQAVPCSDDSV
eukprot:scaffold171171_cov19-Tisochrysis_lutea.AAC.1